MEILLLGLIARGRICSSTDNKKTQKQAISYFIFLSVFSVKLFFSRELILDWFSSVKFGK